MLLLGGLVAAAGSWWLADRQPPAVPSPAAATRGSAQFGGAITAIAVADERVYLAVGRRIEVVDIGDRTRPQLLGQSLPAADTIRAIALLGQRYALAAAGSGGVVIYDVGDPTQIVEVATIPTAWAAHDVATRGQHALIAEGARGLRILDLTRPGEPSDLAQVDTPGDALAVCVAGEHAYVADWGMGVRVIQINVTSPREVAAFDTPGEAADLALDGSRVYVADRRGGLRILEIQADGSLVEAATVAVPGGAERVAASAERAYVATGDGRLAIVEGVSTRQPRRLPDFREVAMVSDVAVADGVVFVADAGTSVAPARKAPGDVWQQFHVWGVQERPEVAKGLGGLRLAEATPTGLATIGFFPSPSLIEALAVHPTDPIMYLADGQAGVIVLDVRHPEAPRWIGTLPSGGAANDVWVSEQLALIAAGAGGLEVLDLRSPERPVAVATIPLPGEALGVTSDGHLAYVAAGEAGGLVVADIAQRKVIAAADTPGMAWDVMLRRDQVYVSDRASLLIYDVRDPAAPRQLASLLSREGDVLDLVLADGHGWVAAGPAGVRVIDLHQPTDPRLIASLPIPDRAIGIALAGQRAFVAAGTAGLISLDVSRARAPRIVTTWPLPGIAERVWIYQGYAYVAAEMGGLQIVPVEP